ncbi:MAG: DUF1549 and DUF1553 domain-containing protein, partial [Verrucomicrobiales bacterium]|nr:DUF1549 and DUF1553 domain-containing protein [Verrucomicrobiales bacterium]
HFVLARLTPLGITPNPPATTPTHARRLNFDHPGRPPTTAQLSAFDPGNTATLLDATEYAEHYARHWLDVARYADSNGYRYDDDNPNAYHYRDFVIRSLDADMPFDQFVRWQVAGDELAPGNPHALAATGFAAVGPKERNEGTTRTRRENRYNELDDLVSTTGSALLGLTLGCARCHDHKTDPVTQREYYALTAAFISGTRSARELITPQQKQRRKEWNQQRQILEDALTSYRQQHAEHLETPLGNARATLRKKLDKTLDKKDHTAVRTRQILGDDNALILHATTHIANEITHPETAAGLGSLAAKLNTHLENRPPDPPEALVYTDTTTDPIPSPLLAGGSIDDPLQPVPFGIVAATTLAASYTPDLSRPENAPASTYHRAALARWLTDSDSGAGHLLARVTANRAWLHHFGRGLVTTPNDFGTTGNPPALPGLLDYLATYLIDHGWSLKKLHAHIIDSATYRQGNELSDTAAKNDPANHFWHRRSPVRLGAEALRDTILATSGRLQLDHRFGPGARLPIPPEQVISRLGQPYPRNIADAPPVWRRSVYTFIKRTVPVPLFRTFDTPDSSASCGRRNSTTVAPQALHLLNNSFVRRRAADLATRLRTEAGHRHSAQVDLAYLLSLSRPPTAAEHASSLAYLAAPHSTLTGFCHVLYTLNEFIYID